MNATGGTIRGTVVRAGHPEGQLRRPGIQFRYYGYWVGFCELCLGWFWNSSRREATLSPPQADVEEAYEQYWEHREECHPLLPMAEECQ